MEEAMRQEGKMLRGLVFIVCASACGCKSDVNHSTETLHVLDMASLVIKSMHNEGVDIASIGSMSEFAKKAHHLHMISDEDVLSGKYEKDAWGNSYHWIKQVEDDKTTIRIVSNGKDGGFQDGKGDDLSVTIVFPLDGNPIVTITGPKYPF